MTKNIFITAIIALVVSLSVSSFNGNQQSNVREVVHEVVGGISERDIVATSFKATPNGELSVSNKGVVTGRVLSTTTPASMTLRPLDLIGYSTISSLPTVSSVTLTLPASTTLNANGFLPKAGDRTTLAIVNASSTSASITLAGNTGSLLRNASTSAVITPGGVGILFITRKANLDFIFSLIPQS